MPVSLGKRKRKKERKKDRERRKSEYTVDWHGYGILALSVVSVTRQQRKMPSAITGNYSLSQMK